ncbi:MAG: hypothetical protein OEW75_06820 [Cyclobacteriaceae bacterium]|nr:hypothetical protein [Cyclobacteriaceae bacterium]
MDYPIQSVLFTSVKFNDQFWAPGIKTNHDITLPFTLGKCDETGRIKNFEIAGGREGDVAGYVSMWVCRKFLHNNE